MHWKNSQFQIAAFIAGKCHTADEARRKLLMLQAERQMSLDKSKITAMKRKARRAAIDAVLTSDDATEWAQLEASAELEEMKQGEEMGKELIAEAEREVAFIEQLIELIEPYRLYADLPDHEAFQVVQREEWLLELTSRAQTYLMCTGGIPVDHFNAMRAHPDWATVISPLINKMAQASKDGQSITAFSKPPKFMEAFEANKLLGTPSPRVTLKAIAK